MASFLDDLNNHKFSTRKPKEEKINIEAPGRQAPYQAPAEGRTIARLQFIKWVYLRSTDGRRFDR